MTKCYKWSVILTDKQKLDLAKSINNKCPLTLRMKHSNLDGDEGDDELMLNVSKLKKLHRAIKNGTGVDVKTSKAQIREMEKHGGNLFTSLASLGAKVLPYAIKGVSKAAPTLATGAVSALGSLGIDKIFGKGIDIPKKFFPMLPYIVNELTKSQIDQINKVS